MIAIVIDDGSSQMKLRRIDGSTTLKLPSTVVNRSVYNMEGISPSCYRVGEHDYTVLPSDDTPERTDTASYQLSPLNLVLVHESLRQAGLGGSAVILGCTLPINQFFELGLGGKPNLARIEAKKAHLKSAIENRAGLPLAIIKDVIVFPEALPAAVDVMCELHDGDLIYKDQFADNQRVCCVDVGGHSVDIVVFETHTRNVLAQDCIESGVIKIVDALQNSMMTLLKETRPIERSIAEASLLKREYDGIDLSGAIAQASSALASKVVSTLERLASKRTTDYFLVVGGGAELVADKVRAYAGEKTIVPAKADESIARGIAMMLSSMLSTASSSSSDQATAEA